MRKRRLWLVWVVCLVPWLVYGAERTGPSIEGRQPVLATDGKSVALAVGRDDGIYFARSADGGRTFGEPVRVVQSLARRAHHVIDAHAR